MSFPLSLFFTCLCVKFVLGEKCTDALHETFKKGLNLTDMCDTCTVLTPRIFFLEKIWTGFCVRNEFFLFEDWKCKKDTELEGNEPFVLVTEKVCESFGGSLRVDVECLRQFNAEMCTEKSGTIVPKTAALRSSEKAISAFSFAKDMQEEKTVATSFSPSSVFRTCESNEFFYREHCYFIKLYGDPGHYFEPLSNNGSKKSSAGVTVINSIKSCQDRHPKALGLAVETEEENKFIFDILKTVHLYGESIIFTSGVRMNDAEEDEWFGWNLKVNRDVLNLTENFETKKLPSCYCINSCQNIWFLFNPMFRTSNATFFIVCERLYNPKETQLELHERCLKMYRESSCYNLNKHKNFCCAKDEQGEIWFACPSATVAKYYKNGLKCDWSCQSDGFFAQERPICAGNFVCRATYDQVKYSAPIQRFASSPCPKPFIGNSSWYCASNRTFLGTPDYSLCCENNTRCTDTDSNLNVWMGCAGKKVKKKTVCPPGTLLKEALVEWFCQENGTFLGNGPDYSNCNHTGLMCSEKDRFGNKWTASPGSTAIEKCPPSYTGHCFWKCLKSGKFEGPQPDCTKCKAAWMEEIAAKIKNDSQHEEVMEIMENFTQKEDLRIGFCYVINLTSDCVSLYKKQASDKQFRVFNKFLKSYSKILKNLAGDLNIWSSFSEENRENYVDDILRTTQNAAFANLEAKNATKEQYNATFTSSSVDGFDFFVAYNPPPEANFPLQNLSQSDWHLKIKEVTGSTNNFAAMGLIMNCSLSSLMFPRGNETKNLKMNAPAITFTVAAATNGEVIIDPNVTVDISFKHAKKTRLPATEVIKRKLHAGEYPSGVFNSTLCFYYRDSDWSTEGCSVTYSSKDRTNCTCNHLSTIGLLMSIHKYEPNRILELVSSLSSGITIVSLILALLVFYFLDKNNNDRLLIGKNLCLCLLIGHIMLFGVMDKKFFNTTDTMCMIYAILLHYVFMASFAWMFVEGCHLYRMLVIVFDSDIDYRWIYLLIGYGGPLGIVGATQLVGLILHEQPYGEDELCWLKTPNYVWAFIGPVILLTTINFCILIVAMKMAVSSRRQTERSNFDTVKLWLKGWISLSALLGITWLFGLGYIYYNENFSYIFVVFNGLQGFFIFLFRCVLCEQYKSVILRKLKSWFSNSKSAGRKKRENLKSETKIYAISATKFSSGEAEAKDSGYETPAVSASDKPNEKQVSRKFLRRTKPKGHKHSEIGIDVNVTLTPAMSEAYLRNRMIAKNFSVRKSKASWMADSEKFPEPLHQKTASKT